MQKPRERRPSLHPGEGHPVDEEVLYSLLVTDRDVVDGGIEEYEAVAGGEDSGLSGETSGREGGAMDVEVGDARLTSDAESGLDLMAAPREVLGGGCVWAVGDVRLEIEKRPVVAA